MANPRSKLIAVTARDAGLVGCTRCTAVWPMDHTRCGRCKAPLQSRDDRSLSRVWAWWWAGLLFYIPANVYPMLITRTLLEEQESTIIGGAIEIALYGDIPVAAIILFASVVIPLSKFAAIAFLAISSRRGTRVPGQQRHLLYEAVEFIGRWSMIDVFVVAITSALVQLNVVASVTPGPAAIAFALSVIFTMLSAQSFDSRMIWDQIEGDERA
ncbi:paraquat-inducible protein A [Aestuariibius insulae]|uniref:paraquat-inducible protein A n=1 Tax=Aestuariibius insulae TaxID=2058287 RepID=UPI00345E4781